MLFVLVKRVFNAFEIKHLDEYHDLYYKSYTLLLADISENFRKMCLKFYELDPLKIYFSSWMRKNGSTIRVIN